MPWIKQSVKSVWSSLAVGDFQWLVCTEYGNTSRPEHKTPFPVRLRLFVPNADEHPTHLRLRVPDALCTLALRGKGTQANGESWAWNDDLEKPTLQQSIAKEGGGWHGWLKHGELTEA